MPLALLFISYVCECCGRTLGGTPVYRAGLRQCPPCASGEHLHRRTLASAA